jgi:hypothetical protein
VAGKTNDAVTSLHLFSAFTCMRNKIQLSIGNPNFECPAMVQKNTIILG